MTSTTREYFSRLVTTINNDPIACQELIFLDQSTQSIVILEEELQRQKHIAQTRLDQLLARHSTLPIYNNMRKQQRKFASIKKPYQIPRRQTSSSSTTIPPEHIPNSSFPRRPTTRSMTKKKDIDSKNQRSSEG